MNASRIEASFSGVRPLGEIADMQAVIFLDPRPDILFFKIGDDNDTAIIDCVVKIFRHGEVAENFDRTADPL